MTKYHKFRWSAWVGALVGLSLLAACSGGATPTPNRLPLKFAYDLWPGYYPALIANEKGFFKDAGVEVEAISPQDTTAMMADFLGGKYDAIAVALGDMVSMATNDPSLRVVLFSDESAGGDAFLATGDIQAIADLKGKTIGVNLGSFAEVFVSVVLEQNGLTRNDVKWVDSDASELPAKLQSGALQAGHTWEPYLSEAVTDGATVLFTTADTPGLVPDGVVFRGEVVKNRPEDVRAFVKAWFQAVDYWQANPAEGNAAAAKALGVDPSTISLDGIALKTLADNQQLFTPGETTASAYYTAKLYVDFFVRTGALTRQLDTDALLEAQFVK